jgi:acetylornithine deacetylase
MEREGTTIVSAPLESILDHLERLVAIDTRNPPRDITPDGPLVAAIRDALPGFDVHVTDLGEGSIIIDAVRGRPSFLFNVHMDTVPVADGWTQDPFRLHRGDRRARGLGACDIKGAAAVLFTLAAATDAPLRIVLTTDEEAGQSRCIREFVKTLDDVQFAVVAEPTTNMAVLGHRGLLSAVAAFSGRSGHSSTAAPNSAVHSAARWIVRCLDLPEASENRLNFGRIEGGVKPNMIAASCEVRFGFRPAPGVDSHALLDKLSGLSSQDLGKTIAIRFDGPALPAGDDAAARNGVRKAEEIVRAAGLATGAPVDFFTEASIFAAAGVPAFVLGPGDIRQAHAADEHVDYEQLSGAFTEYMKLVASHG